MLRWRLVLGFAIGGLLTLLFILDAKIGAPNAVLLPLALLFALVGAQEMIGLLKNRSLRPPPALIYVGVFAVVASNAMRCIWPTAPLVNLEWPLAAFVLVTMTAFAVEVFAYRQPGASTERLAAGVLSVAYVGLLFSFVVQMRWLGPEHAWGVPAIAALLIVVKACDVGAYTIGRIFGKHKLAPRVSPGKTIQGGVGGIAFAVAFSYLTFAWLLPWWGVPWPGGWGWAVYGLLVGGAGMLGDLAESLLKRDLGRKDSSTWMPGFGGILDMLDSILYAAPVAWLLWKLAVVP